MISEGWWNDWWWICDEFGTSSGHWWCIFGGWWCIPNPKPIWWALWCVCGGTWLWLLFEFALFEFACCLCEFFLFFIRRFWNLQDEKFSSETASRPEKSKNSPNLHLTLGQVQISRQLPALLFRYVSIEQKLLLEFERLEFGIRFALFADGYDLIWPFQRIWRCRRSDAWRSRYCWTWRRRKK